MAGSEGAFSGGSSSGSGAYQGPSEGYGGAGYKGPSPTHQGGAGDVVDFQSMLEAMQADRQAESETWGKKYSSLEQQHKKTAETLGKIQKVFSGGEEETNPTAQKIAGYEAQLDHYLQAAVDAERNGRAIPLTTNLAIQFFQSKIEQERERDSWLARIDALENRLKKVDNPENVVDSISYQNMDTNVMQALDAIYGPEINDTKRYQYQAITQAIGAEIKDLKANDPALWDDIRRNPKKQAQLVQHFVKQTIPPRAREILFEDQIRKEPMTVNELTEAFHEAGEIEDPRQRKEIREKIRQEIVARKFGGA